MTKLPKHTEMNVIFLNGLAMRRLHNQIKGVDTETDVLSLPLHTNRPFHADPDRVIRLGDVYIAIPVAKDQARTFGHSFGKEIGRLFIHGFLHLIGRDHDTPEKARAMNKEEETLGRKIKINTW